MTTLKTLRKLAAWGAATGCALLAFASAPVTASAAASASATRAATALPPHAHPMVDTLQCTGGGSHQGSGHDNLDNGTLTVQVCAYGAAHKVTDVRVDYEKSDGDCVSGLDFHWRWANKRGEVKNGDADDQGSFSECSGDDKYFEWHYGDNAPSPLTADAPYVVGTLTTGTTTYVTQPVKW